MDKNTKWIIGIVVAIIVIWVGYRGYKQGGQTPGQRAGTTTSGSYKIGVSFPMTGDAAVYGEPGRNIVNMAIEEINSAGGVNGKKLATIFEDDKCNGKDATNAAQKLVNVDKVQVIIGSLCSSASLAEVPIVTVGKVVLFSPGSTNPGLTGSSKYFFRDIPSDASQGQVDADVSFKRGFKTVAFIVEQKDYPLGVYKAFDAHFTSLGGKTIKEEFPVDATDFRAQLTKLKAQKPDALFIDPQAPASAERILKQMQELKWKPNILLNEATAGDQKTLMANKDALEGAETAEFFVDPANTKFQHLKEVYKQKFGQDLPYESYSTTEYDAVYAITDGIRKVGYDGEKLATWSRTIKDWQGASGKLTIKPDGDRESGYSPEIIKGGKTAPWPQ